MSEYSEIACRTYETANALHGYLLSQLNEDEYAPAITARVEGLNLYLTYERDGEPQRSAWDRQLIGYRDAFELCRETYRIPFVGVGAGS